MTDLLAGIRVLDFTLAAVGPFCSRILADLGAEVIHVEFPRNRWAGQSETDQRFTSDRIRGDRGVQLFLHCNGGKLSLAVNLKEECGVELIRRLIPETDVVVENMTPRVMQSLGLSYAELSAINPGLVMCSLTGFGQAGLDGDLGRPCTDPIAQAMSGMTWSTGERAPGPPYAVGGGIGDPIAGLTGAAGILAALVGRATTGRGQHVDVSMVEAAAFVDCTTLPAVAMNGSAATAPYRNGQQNSYTFPMGPFRCTGGYLAIQAPGGGEGSPWARLCKLMDREDLVTDERYLNDAARLQRPDEVIRFIEDWLCSLDSRESALHLLAVERISAGPVLSHEEMLGHPFFVSRGTFGKVEYPGVGPVGVVEPPFKFSSADAYVRGPAPEMGEHTRELVKRLLHLENSDVDELIGAGVLYEAGVAV